MFVSVVRRTRDNYTIVAVLTLLGRIACGAALPHCAVLESRESDILVLCLRSGQKRLNKVTIFFHLSLGI